MNSNVNESQIDIWLLDLSKQSVYERLCSNGSHIARRINLSKSESKHNKNQIISNCLKRRVLSQYLDLKCNDNLLSFSFTKYGKPFMDLFDIYFNISHSKNIIIMAVSSLFEIGIDIEYLDKDFFDSIQSNELDYIFTSSERSQLYSSSINSIKKFFDFWTIKESYLKCLGVGLVDNLYKVEVNSTYKTVKLLDFPRLAYLPLEINSNFSSHITISKATKPKINYYDANLILK